MFVRYLDPEVIHDFTVMNEDLIAGGMEKISFYGVPISVITARQMHEVFNYQLQIDLLKHRMKIETYQIHSSSFAQGFIIAIINPKILIWFTAIYSQFIDINSTFLNKTILVLTPSIIDAIWYSLVAILVTGYGLKEMLNNKKFMIQKIIGILLILIAFSLIYSLIRF
mgnify:CR=1 FL=1